MTTVGSLIEWSAKNYPDKLGLVYKEKNHYWTFQQFNDKVNQFANALTELGVRKGDVVSTYLYNSSDFPLTQLAAAKIGAIFNPINYRLAAGELEFILDNAESKVLVFDEEGKETVAKVHRTGLEIEHYIFTNTETPNFAVQIEAIYEQQSTDEPEIDVTENDPYIIMYMPIVVRSLGQKYSHWCCIKI